MEEEETSTTETSTASDDAATQTNDKADAGRLAALKAEREKRQAAEQRLAELEAAEAERVRKAAEAAGEHEKLYATEKQRADKLDRDAKAAKDEAKQLREILEADFARRLEALPEDQRPPMAGLDLAARRELLVWAESRAAAAAPHHPGGVQTGKGAKREIPPDVRAEWEALRATNPSYNDLDWYVENVAEPRRKRNEARRKP